MRLMVVDDLVPAAAALFESLIRAALHEHERASFALSGGSTPWPILDRLAAADLDWDRVDLHQVDERVAPRGHQDRNLTRLSESALSNVGAVVHAMPVEDADLDAAAARYASALPPTIDIVHLGLGADGHTASLVPGDPVLGVRDRDVAITGEYMGRRRMTLTFPALERAETVVWLVTGASKSDALSHLLAGDSAIPAGMVSTRNPILVTDLPTGAAA